jgi:hypothetical protein
MDYTQLSMDLTFSDTAPNMCVNLSTNFNADANNVSFNVNLTTLESTTAVTLNPTATTVNILDGRQFSAVFHNLISRNLPDKEKLLILSLSFLSLSLSVSLPLSHTLTTLVITPTIVTQPMDIENAFPGANIIFTVVAEGGALRYQWFRNGAGIAGATQATLTLVGVTVEIDEGMYSCFISNQAGNTTTIDVSLTICKYMGTCRDKYNCRTSDNIRPQCHMSAQTLRWADKISGRK